MKTREHQTSFLETGSCRNLDSGIVSITGNSEKARRQSLVEEITKILKYKPDESVVDKIDLIIKEGKADSVGGALFIIND